MTTHDVLSKESRAEQRRKLLAQLLREKARSAYAVSPASSAQRGLWFMQQMEPGSSVYHISFSACVQSEIDPGCVRAALQQLIDRHSMLRTTFRGASGDTLKNPGDEVEMLVHGAADAHLTEIDAAGWTDQEMRQRAERSFREPFDLQNGPLVRLHLFSRDRTDHVFLLVLHHIICDGWSLGILLQEFIECYEAGIVSRSARLAALELDFPEFVDQRQRRLNGPEGERSKTYWLEQLSGELPRLQLPESHSRRESPADSNAVHFFEIDESLYRRLNELARSCGATLFSVLLAAYQTWLMRLSGQREIVVGVPMHGRTELGYQAMVGHFVNLVAIRSDLRAEVSFRELVERAQEGLRGAMEHQEFPFSELVRMLRPAGRSEHNPLFRTTLNVLKPMPGDPLARQWFGSQDGVQWGPLRVASFPLEPADEPYDIAVRIIDTGDRFEVRLQYNGALFDAERMAGFAGCLAELLHSAAGAPDRPISQLALLSPTGREQVLESWNSTATEFPRHAAVHQLLAEQAGRTPDAAALVFRDSKFSYRELDRRANQLARYLRRQGIGRNDLVAVCAERSPELIIGVLGVLKAGGAYVPVDPKFPADRVRTMLLDSGARLVLTTQQCDGSIGAITGARRFCMDRDREELSAFVGDELPSITEPLDLAYVIYTSGSTGQPKGVEIPHRALVNLLWSMRERPGLSASDVLLSVTTFSFDIFGLEMFLPLMVGARLELASDDEVLDGRLLAKRLERCHATVMQATPVTWRMLCGAGFRPAGSFKALCGGEALPPDLAAQLLAAGVDLWNMYGPTETTIWSCVEHVRETNGGISIGRPISNTQAYVLDAQLQPVPVGVRGELCLSGDGLARGYRNRAEMTAESFLAHPFLTAEGARLYRTGDWARYRADGNLEILGRVDNQVKVRGHRIELEEVESVLRRCPGVPDAVAAAREDRLIAYVMGTVSEETLRNHARQYLPDYMVPSQFVRLDELPRAPNGKIDRRGLPEPGRQGGQTAYIPPADALEARLAALWERLLEVRPVGRQDNFFDLGGHSLLALRMFAEIERDFGSSIPVASLYEAPTVEQLAALLRAGRWSPRWSSLVTLQPSGRLTPFFCVHDATGHAFIYRDLALRLGPDQPVYALESQGLAGAAEPLLTVEAMAAHYIKEMREVQPSGPYMIGGFCIGAHIALEMAHQLQAQGESVPILASFNANAQWKTVRSLRDSVRLHRDRIGNGNFSRVLGYARERTLYRLYRWSGAQAHVRAEAYRAFGRPVPAKLRGALVRELNFRAMQRYAPRKYEGTILYFQGSGDVSEAVEVFWTHVATRVETHVIPGRWVEILREPGVQTLARKLDECLARLR